MMLTLFEMVNDQVPTVGEATAQFTEVCICELSLGSPSLASNMIVVAPAGDEGTMRMLKNVGSVQSGTGFTPV